MLSKEQRLGAAIVLGAALVAWIGMAVWPETPKGEPAPKKKHRTWEERKDSMRLADSLRYAEWAAEREQRYDSFRTADSLRRVELRAQLKRLRDSARVADSLWRDSMGIHFVKRVKKDTILDLNHCDTTELQYIRGIGRYTAIQIVNYREQLGGYYSPTQLTDEPFAKCHLDTLLHHFTADPADVRTLNINTCSTDALQRHPYLRYHQAKAIYTFRRQRIRLQSLDELSDLPELTDEDLSRLSPYLRFE